MSRSNPAGDAQQQEAPLFQAIVEYGAAGILPLHTPGHKLGAGASPRLKAALGQRALKLDASDEVWAPEHHHDMDAVRREAEVLLAAAYGSDNSFFLVNGSSQGIQAAFLALRQIAGDSGPVLIPRSSHISALQGLLLSGLNPLFLPPRFDPEWGILIPPSAAGVVRRVTGGTAKGVFVTRPDYFGLSIDLAAVVHAAHSVNLPVIVDEAHGPHLGFHQGLPESALHHGADIVVQSPHKLLGALTGGAYLHCQGDLIPSGVVADGLSLLTSTSPSHLLLASLDEARRQMAVEGRALMDQTLRLAYWTREQIKELDGFRCLDKPKALELAPEFDPTKLLINVSDLGLTGPEAEELLRTHCGVQVELSTASCVLALVTIGDTPQSMKRFLSALKDLRELAVRRRKSDYDSRSRQRLWTRRMSVLMDWPDQKPTGYTPREAFWSSKRPVPWDSAVGEVAAEWVIPYPPGVPLLIPGEEITREVVDYLWQLKSVGVTVRGMQDPEGLRVRVVR